MYELWETTLSNVGNNAEFNIIGTIVISLGFKLVQSFTAVLAGFICLAILKRLIQRLLRLWKPTISERKMQTLNAVLTSLSKFTIIFVVVCNILIIFGINVQSLLAVAGVGSVAIGFGAQSMVKDFITGVFILLEDQFGIGDIISLNGHTGTVEAIGIRTTRIRSFEGDLHIIPNSQINIVTNMSKEFKRATLDIAVPYDSDVNKVLEILRSEVELAAKKMDDIISLPTVLGISELRESSIIIKVVADCKPGTNWNVERELRRLIRIRFNNENIKTPYPQLIIKNRE